jgi:hypothetical protein
MTPAGNIIHEAMRMSCRPKTWQDVLAAFVPKAKTAFSIAHARPIRSIGS